VEKQLSQNYLVQDLLDLKKYKEASINFVILSDGSWEVVTSTFNITES
jgi:hypothetical protein